MVPGESLISAIKLYVDHLWYQNIFNVCFTNFIHASTCSLFWWWYDDENACSMFKLLQNVLNLTEMKLPPKSDIIFFHSMYSAKIILQVSIRLSADKSSVFFMTGNFP